MDAKKGEILLATKNLKDRKAERWEGPESLAAKERIELKGEAGRIWVFYALFVLF